MAAAAAAHAARHRGSKLEREKQEGRPTPQKVHPSVAFPGATRHEEFSSASLDEEKFRHFISSTLDDGVLRTLARDIAERRHQIANAITNDDVLPSREVPHALTTTINELASPRGDDFSATFVPKLDDVVAYEYPNEGFWKHQRKTRDIYTDNRVVIFVAGLIVFNFVVSMTEKQIDPGPVPLKYTWTWFSFALFFNVCFTIELGVNMCVSVARRVDDPKPPSTGRIDESLSLVDEMSGRGERGGGGTRRHGAGETRGAERRLGFSLRSPIAGGPLVSALSGRGLRARR